MHSTKTEILTLLKRSDGATVDDLSTSLGLASMTVRQHLTALERDALVSAHEVRRATGRPHYRYQLTEDGHRHISDGYDRLVALLVQETGNVDVDENFATADERRRRLFRRTARALAAPHAAEVRALAGEAQAERIIAILRSHGGFAESHARPDGYELRDFSCVFRATVGRDGACDWHETLLATLLDAPVRVAPPAEAGCAACCQYIIETGVAEPATTTSPTYRGQT